MPSAKRAGHLIKRKMFMLKRFLDTAKVEHVAARELLRRRHQFLRLVRMPSERRALRRNRLALRVALAGG